MDAMADRHERLRASLREQAELLVAKGREVAAHAAEVEEYVAHVHDELAATNRQLAEQSGSVDYEVRASRATILADMSRAEAARMRAVAKGEKPPR
jgi:hypothetical protein